MSDVHTPVPKSGSRRVDGVGSQQMSGATSVAAALLGTCLTGGMPRLCDNEPSVMRRLLCPFSLSAVNETEALARAVVQSEGQHTPLPYEDVAQAYCQEATVGHLHFPGHLFLP